MNYEELIIEYEKDVMSKELPLKHGFKGLYKNNKIIINSNIETNKEKACIFAEELGHHFTTYGDIIDQNNIMNIKQEHKARAWAYEKLVRIPDLINAHKSGVKGKYYNNKYGAFYKIDNYIIYFSPNFGIMEFF